MLQISNKFRILPKRFELGPRPLSIDDSSVIGRTRRYSDYDDAWQLDRVPDVDALEHFWDEVQADLQSDPGWSTFCD